MSITSFTRTMLGLVVTVLIAAGARPASGNCGFGPNCGPCQVCECSSNHPNACGCLPDPHPCDDNDACTVDVCNPLAGGACTHSRAPLCCTSDGACEDGDACTTSSCVGLDGVGVCSPQATKNCDDGSGYTDDSCDPSTGQCRHTTAVVHCGGVNDCPDPIHDLCSDGLCQRLCSIDNDCPGGFKCSGGVCLLGDCQGDADCDDHRICNGKETCDGRRCLAGTRVVCADDHNPCTTETCTEALGCVGFQNAGACNDGNPCTINDQCKDGACYGAPGCDDGDPCTNDLCSGRLGICKHSAVPGCISGSTTSSTVPPATTTSSTSTSTTTTSSTSTTLPPLCTTIADCDDSDACTQDLCRTTECTHLPLRNFAAITCLCGDAPPACSSRPMPRGFGPRFQQACALVSTASAAYGNSSVILRPQLTRALKKFRKSCRAVDRAEVANRIVPGCATALGQRCRQGGDRANGILVNGLRIRGG